MQLFTSNNLSQLSLVYVTSGLNKSRVQGNRVSLATSFCPVLDLQADRAVKMILLVEDEAAKRNGVNVRLVCNPLMVRSSTGSIWPGQFMDKLSSMPSREHSFCWFRFHAGHVSRSTLKGVGQSSKNIYLNFNPLTKTCSPLNPLNSSFVILTQCCCTRRGIR